MKFIVEENVFKKLENVCFGIVVAKGIDNKSQNDKIDRLLDESIQNIEEKFKDKNVKESKEILPYRIAFNNLKINPNKYMSSIEAMASRIAKKKGFPKINSIVNLGNAISLKYLIPLGAHDINSSKENIYVRFSNDGDEFIPFGQKEIEILEKGELIYSVGNKVKTRRWIWRQSEQGKITEQSKNVFFPIDGFKDKNYDNVINARNELARLLKELFNCEIEIGFIDKDNREFEF